MTRRAPVLLGACGARGAQPHAGAALDSGGRSRVAVSLHLSSSLIKYIGSKRTLMPRIVALARALAGRRRAPTACDLFCGTTRVAQGLKAAGFHVTANDTASYAEVLATAYVEADAKRVRKRALAAKIAHLNALPGRDGYVTRTFCEEARYFQPFNGRRIDAMREEIERIAEGRAERAILLTALLQAADRVDSTTGLQMAYLKAWAPRSFNPIELRVPELLAGRGRATRMDANALAREMDAVDVAYVDPPYNQHSYHSNYHVWETLVRYDAPEAYGIARKRGDCRTTKSAYNSRDRAWAAFASLLADVRARHVIVSFNDEGYFTTGAIARLLAETRGEVATIPIANRRYVGARIGIYNPRGEKVGRVSHVTNHEFLFIAGPGARAASRAARAA
ncbi:MAG TPA: DNA adenine methylase [Gemmatimonadaceae bacterium]|nr:DNA adenine methylase [Gemmatimonadaceae bacterium]